MRELRYEKKINEILKNDLNAEKKINERLMKSQADMNQLNQKMRKIFKGKKVKYDLDTMKKKVNLPSKVLEGIKSPHAIIVERKVTHQTNARAMEKKNSMESVITTISMVTKLMNSRRNQNLKVNVINARSKVTRYPSADQSHSIQLNNL